MRPEVNLDQPLPRRHLGSSGLELSILGLGTVKLGRNRGVKYPSGFALPSDREAADLLALAGDLGINLLDTAPAYGSSEERLGELLRGQRHRWHICTKVGEEFDGTHSHFDFSPAHAVRSVERSLRRLNTDFLDMVLVHSDGNDVDIIENQGTLAALADLKAAGKIRAIGMSTKTVAGGVLAAQHCDCVMVTWNLQHAEEVPVIERCRELNRGVLIKKALASGHIAPAGNEDPVKASFRMLFDHQAVTSAIVGTINPKHLQSNVQAAIGVTN